MSHITNGRSSQILALRTSITTLQEELDFANGTVPALDRCFDRRETLTGTCDKHGEYQQLRIWTEKSLKR